MNDNDKLGEGSYGCVLKGVLGYSTNQLNNSIMINTLGEVSKLFLYEKDFRRELKNTIIANKLDQNTSLIINSTSIYDKKDLNEIFNDDNNKKIFEKINLCDEITKNLRKLDNIYQIVFNNKGIDLDSLDMFIENFNIVSLIKMFENLFKSISIYRKHNFNHFDIKENNIIYLPNEKKMVYIDYGISCYDDDIDIVRYLKQFSKDNDSMKLYQQPELIAYGILMQYKDQIKKEDVYLKCFEEFKQKYNFMISYEETNFRSFLINFLYKKREIFDNELKKLFDKIYEDFKENSFNKFLISEYMTNIDVYSLSWVLIILMNHYKFMKIKKREEQEFVTRFCNDILVKAIQIDPQKRYKIDTIVENYKLFSDI